MFTSQDRSYLYNPSHKALHNKLGREDNISRKSPDKKITQLLNVKTTTVNRKYISSVTNVNDFTQNYAKFIQLETYNRIKEVRSDTSKHRILSQAIIFVCLCTATIMGLYSLNDVAHKKTMPIMSDMVTSTKKIL